MIVIKHRFTGETLCEFDVMTTRQAAEKGKADLGEANLGGADLGGANLGGADLYRADLGGADLYRADLGGADLYGADLYGADLREADLRGANLCRADLHGADLREADLRGADLYGADLRGADLYGANLHGADLREADLREVNLGEKFGRLKAGGFFSVGPLGSRNDTLLAFHTEKGVFVHTGCFFDSLDEFRDEVIETYGENSKHGKLYLGVANIIEFKFSPEEEE